MGYTWHTLQTTNGNFLIVLELCEVKDEVLVTFITLSLTWWLAQSRLIYLLCLPQNIVREGRKDVCRISEPAQVAWEIHYQYEIIRSLLPLILKDTAKTSHMIKSFIRNQQLQFGVDSHLGSMSETQVWLLCPWCFNLYVLLSHLAAHKLPVLQCHLL